MARGLVVEDDDDAEDGESLRFLAMVSMFTWPAWKERGLAEKVEESRGTLVVTECNNDDACTAI